MKRQKKKERHNSPERSVAPVLLATALINLVFPHPGGPYSKTPFEGLILRRAKDSGFLKNAKILIFCII